VNWIMGHLFWLTTWWATRHGYIVTIEEAVADPSSQHGKRTFPAKRKRGSAGSDD
jgi:hypothetical protein